MNLKGRAHSDAGEKEGVEGSFLVAQGRSKWLDKKGPGIFPPSIHQDCTPAARLLSVTSATAGGDSFVLEEENLLAVSRLLPSTAGYTSNPKPAPEGVLSGEPAYGSLLLLEIWSGRRESNPRPTAWEAVTLPLSYSRSVEW